MITENRVIRTRFKQLRKSKGSQDFVGSANNVTGTTIRYIENGYVIPSGKLMLRLANYFESTVEELFAPESE